MVVQAQDGQNQTGATTNNNGGKLVLASGSPGTGGTSATGVQGSVDIQTGTTAKVRVFPTFSTNAFDSNTLFIDESIIRIGAGQSIPLIRQDATTNAAGQSFTLQAQNAATTGGPLLLQSGTGATNDGYINLITGATVKMTIFPTTAVSGANSNSILYFENLFRVDAAQTNPLFRQDDLTTNSGTGNSYTIQAQNETGTTSTGGLLALKAGTGTSVGGGITLTTGTGATNAGLLNIVIGAVQTLAVNDVDTNADGYAELIAIGSTITNPRIFQSSTASATGSALLIEAQNAATTGGALALSSGTGSSAANAGQVEIQTGLLTRIVVNPTFTTFQDTAEALRITPVSAGTTQITFASTDTAAQINQTLTSSTPSAPMTIQSQVTSAASGQGGTLSLIAGNATGTTSTGGALNLASGSGTTTNGVINFQPGGTTQLLLSATGQTLQWVNTVVTPTLNQANISTASTNGQNLIVQAQNALGTTSTGGSLQLTSGTGTTAAGLVNILIGTTQTAAFNSVDSDSDGYANWLAAGPTINKPNLYQTVQAGTGANNGFDFKISAQPGQQQTGGSANNNGGNLDLASGPAGTGGAGAAGIDGYVNIITGSTLVASAVQSKWVYNAGRRRHITQITSGSTYAVLTSDDYIAITVLSAPFTVNLPASPVLGDTYEVKDTTGNAGAQNVTVSGNGNNIDGSGSFVLNSAYESIVVTWTGTQWSIS
jgi:hypothetical protein